MAYFIFPIMQEQIKFMTQFLNSFRTKTYNSILFMDLLGYTDQMNDEPRVGYFNDDIFYNFWVLNKIFTIKTA